MHNRDMALREDRNNELIADFNSFYTNPMMSTPLGKIKAFATKTFIQNVFVEVKFEIKKVGALKLSFALKMVTT